MQSETTLSVADIERAEPAPVPFSRRTDAVMVLLVSENGTVIVLDYITYSLGNGKG